MGENLYRRTKFSQLGKRVKCYLLFGENAIVEKICTYSLKKTVLLGFQLNTSVKTRDIMYKSNPNHAVFMVSENRSEIH